MLYNSVFTVRQNSREKSVIIKMGKNKSLCNIVVVWITDSSLTSRPEKGAPLGPGWAGQAAFLGQTWLHHYWEGETTRHGQHCCLQE